MPWAGNSRAKAIDTMVAGNNRMTGGKYSMAAHHNWVMRTNYRDDLMAVRQAKTKYRGDLLAVRRAKTKYRSDSLDIRQAKAKYRNDLPAVSKAKAKYRNMKSAVPREVMEN